jgi:hypothetical protein
MSKDARARVHQCASSSPKGEPTANRNRGENKSRASVREVGVVGARILLADDPSLSELSEYCLTTSAADRIATALVSTDRMAENVKTQHTAKTVRHNGNSPPILRVCV